MKKFIYINICFLSLILSSCYYKEGCWYSPQNVYCPQKNFKSDVQRYYKIDGQPVSEEQKINDIKTCGVVPDKDGNFFRAIRKANPKDDGFDASKKVGECMKAKNYKYDNVYN